MMASLFKGYDRRRYARLDIQIKVKFKINGEGEDAPWHEGMTRNISTEGMFLTTKLLSRAEWANIAQKRKHLYLDLVLTEGQENIKIEASLQRIAVEAEIVWHHHKIPEEDRDKTHPCSLGLQFVKIKKDDKEAIRRYITNSLIKRYNPA